MNNRYLNAGWITILIQGAAILVAKLTGNGINLYIHIATTVIIYFMILETLHINNRTRKK